MESSEMNKRQIMFIIMILAVLCWIMLGAVYSQPIKRYPQFDSIKNTGQTFPWLWKKDDPKNPFGSIYDAVNWQNFNLHKDPEITHTIKKDTIKVIVLLADTSTTSFYYQIDEKSRPVFNSNVIYVSQNRRLGFLSTISFAWCIRTRKLINGNIYYSGDIFPSIVETTYLDYYSGLPFPKSVFVYLLRECE